MSESEDMADLERAYAEAGDSDGNGDFDDLEPGTYRVEVEDAEFCHSRAGRPMIAWQLMVLGPRAKGETVHHYHILEKRRMRWLRRDIDAIGHGDCSSLGELKERLPKLKGLRIEIEAVRRGTTTFYNFLGLESTTAPNPATASVEEDVPF